ncbi:UNVERIFIED_CONTAM: hypothetical protein K2H54_054276 [Gekko kuhli]
MASKGYQWTALECWTKTKGLRLGYKKVMAHNSKPYYEELNQILQRRASVMGRTLSHSLEDKTVPRTNEGSIRPSQEATLDHFPSQSGVTICINQLICMSTSRLKHAGVQHIQTIEQPPTKKQHGIPGLVKLVTGADGYCMSTAPWRMIILFCLPPEFPPGVNLSDLSPNSHLAVIMAHVLQPFRKLERR